VAVGGARREAVHSPGLRVLAARAGDPLQARRQALARLLNRDEFASLEDYVIVNRLGRRLDASAVRRRYKNACTQAGLRPVRLHGLRHAAGSLVARTNDLVFVRDFLGHSKLATTDRYVSAKLRPEEFERLDRAFGIEPGEHTADDERSEAAHR